MLAAALTVIVAVQVSLLRLGAEIGHSVQRVTQLQNLNQQYRAKVAALADDQRIEQLAAGMGMVMPAPTAVSFVAANSSASPSDAAATVTAPDAAGFTSRLQASQAAANAAVGTSSQAVASAAVGASSPGAATAALGTSSPATAVATTPLTAGAGPSTTGN